MQNEPPSGRVWPHTPLPPGLQFFFDWILLFVFFGAGTVAGQGTLDPRPVAVLTTGGGTPLVTTNHSVAVDPAITGPQLQFTFGFATEELAGPGQIFDSFTISLQGGDNPSLTAIFFTADVFGVHWAPPNPGGVAFDESLLVRTGLTFPLLQPDLREKLAFLVTFQLPSELQGRPLTLFYDLFDNLDAQRSLGWFGTVTVIPEPSISALVGLALLFLFVVRRGERRWRAEVKGFP